MLDDFDNETLSDVISCCLGERHLTHEPSFLPHHLLHVRKQSKLLASYIADVRPPRIAVLRENTGRLKTTDFLSLVLRLPDPFNAKCASRATHWILRSFSTVCEFFAAKAR